MSQFNDSLKEMFWKIINFFMSKIKRNVLHKYQYVSDSALNSCPCSTQSHPAYPGQHHKRFYTDLFPDDGHNDGRNMLRLNKLCINICTFVICWFFLLVCYYMFRLFKAIVMILH